jgi:hypothetical protein
MKPADKILTYEQARELRWFCKNVTGTRQEFYEVFDRANKFNERLARLEKTCELIEMYFKDHGLAEGAE